MPSVRAAKPSAPASWYRSLSEAKQRDERATMPLAPCNGAPVHAFTTGGGPFWGRRKRFRRSVAQWLEHRSPNSALAIPPNSTPCHLINVFGPQTRSQSGRYTVLCYRVPSNWFAKMLAADSRPAAAGEMNEGPRSPDAAPHASAAKCTVGAGAIWFLPLFSLATKRAQRDLTDGG